MVVDVATLVAVAVIVVVTVVVAVVMVVVMVAVVIMVVVVVAAEVLDVVVVVVMAVVVVMVVVMVVVVVVVVTVAVVVMVCHDHSDCHGRGCGCGRGIPPIYGPISNRKTRVRYKTHKITQTATALAQRCTSWCRQLRACVQTPDINPRGILCLLDGLGGAPKACFASSFSGSAASNNTPPTMGIAVALSPIATTIPLRWRRMMARSKARDLVRQFGWSAANQVDNNVADMAIPLAPLNLRRDSMASVAAKRVMSFCLI